MVEGSSDGLTSISGAARLFLLLSLHFLGTGAHELTLDQGEAQATHLQPEELYVLHGFAKV